MKRLVVVAVALIALTLSACGNSEINTAYRENSEVQSEIEDVNKDDIDKEEINSGETMVIYSQADSIREFTSMEALAGYAPALVKVEVMQADSANVRSYIYTSYQVKILDTVYGNVSNAGDILCVNMPGGVIQGDDAQEMIAEITQGKDAGDLSQVNELVSNGDTDRLLEVGDEAYLFLVKESETAYAVAGQYRGELLLDNGEVVIDSNITSFAEGVSAYGLEDGKMEENEFVKAIQEMKNISQGRS